LDDYGYSVDINGDPSLITGAVSSAFSGVSSGLNFGGGGGGFSLGGLGGGSLGTSIAQIERLLGFGPAQSSNNSTLLLLAGAVVLVMVLV
jgi:hypothetical protein